jgi:hypothetical protein
MQGSAGRGVNKPLVIPEGHSPLGGSSMARAIACPGSVRLSYGLGDGEDDDTFSKPGTAAHALAEACLKTGKDAWEYIGSCVTMSSDGSDSPVVDKEMADAVQVYLSHIRRTCPERNQGNSGVEEFVHAPSIHPYFWMATDFWHLPPGTRRLKIKDYKHGVGIVVEPVENVQGMYYACGVLEKHELWSEVDDIEIEIVQPRAFHRDGPIRSWTVSVGELGQWLDDVLIPAMDRALVSRDTAVGQHCRFCPAAGRQCPAILDATEELAEMIDKLKLGAEDAAPKLTKEHMSRFYGLKEVFKIADKHVSRAIFGALQAGVKIDGCKLVTSKTNRAWKDGAEKALVKALGKEAYADRELKSPAQIEDLPGGEVLVARWSMKPPGGLTVASDRDQRTGITKDNKSGFTVRKPKGKK